MAMLNLMEVPNVNAGDKATIQQLVVASNDYEVRIAMLEWRLIKLMVGSCLVSALATAAWAAIEIVRLFR